MLVKSFKLSRDILGKNWIEGCSVVFILDNLKERIADCLKM